MSDREIVFASSTFDRVRRDVRGRGTESSPFVRPVAVRGRHRRRRALSTLRIGLAVADVAMPGVTRVSELKLAFVAPLAWPPSWDGRPGRGSATSMSVTHCVHTPFPYPPPALRNMQVVMTE